MERQVISFKALLLFFIAASPSFAREPDVDVAFASYGKLFEFVRQTVENGQPGVGMLLPVVISVKLETKIDNANLKGLDHDKPFAYRAVISEDGLVKGAFYLPVEDGKVFWRGFMPDSMIKKNFIFIHEGKWAILYPKRVMEEKMFLSWKDKPIKISKNELMHMTLRGEYVIERLRETLAVWSLIREMRPFARWLKMLADGTEKVNLSLFQEGSNLRLQKLFIPKDKSELEKFCSRASEDLMMINQLSTVTPVSGSISIKASDLILENLINSQQAALNLNVSNRDGIEVDKNFELLKQAFIPAMVFAGGEPWIPWQGHIVLKRKGFKHQEIASAIENLVQIMQENAKASVMPLYKEIELKKIKSNAKIKKIQMIQVHLNAQNPLLKRYLRLSPPGTQVPNQIQVWTGFINDAFVTLSGSRKNFFQLCEQVEKGELKKWSPGFQSDAYFSLKLGQCKNWLSYYSGRHDIALPDFDDKDLVNMGLQMTKYFGGTLEIPDKTLSKLLITIVQASMQR